ncbi:MAG: ribosome silencing factor [Ignavibacteriae bacterium]|nr:ribosome silencing factor [Ignavibacteria bacterium]MBI3364307.1 ribosome silencing factor [Ignavibacteriota bacterium]
MTPKTLAKKIAHLALTKKAHKITILDLRKLTDMTDFFVICSADSDIQVKAIADTITDGTEMIGVSAWHREGISQRQWVLLDYVDVVVHIFHREARRFYGLEKLWGDAKIEIVEDDSERPTKADKKTPAGKPRAVKAAK